MEKPDLTINASLVKGEIIDIINMNFEMNLSIVLAHTIVFENRVEGVYLFAGGGDSYAPTVNESMSSIMQAMTQNLPALMQVTNAQVTPTAQAQLAASQATSPGYMDLQNQMYSKYGPQLAQTGSDIAQQNAINQARSDLAVMSGPGQQLIKTALDTQKLADPEYYAMREKVGGAYNDLLSSLGISGLSDTERESAQREINASNANRGLSNNPSQIATVENASQMGDALAKKQERIANILGVGANLMPATKSGTDVFQVATGKSSQANSGDNKWMNPSEQSGQNAYSMSNSLLNSGTQLQSTAMDVNSKRRDSMDRFLQAYQTLGPQQFSGIL